jgi:hypothetical protein
MVLFAVAALLLLAAVASYWARAPMQGTPPPARYAVPPAALVLDDGNLPPECRPQSGFTC